MKKYKICVYAICKNESKNLQTWLTSLKDADRIFVLDTGSEDDSMSILKKYPNVVVKQKKYSFFRFDEARNDSLAMVDEDCDICVCCDIDERFEKNWRQIIEENWDNETKMIYYRYTWNFNEDGSEGTVFYISKIHTRKDFIWEHPVHEVLKYIGKEPLKSKTIKELRLYHHADNSKSRSSYLPLLELSVKEDPDDDRNMHYLGREYMFYRKYDKAIETLKKHLTLKKATWKDERAASYRYIARCYLYQHLYDSAKEYYYRAIIEAPYLREAYIEMAFLLQELQDYYGVVYFINEALKIKNRSLTYINEARCWDQTPYDLISVAFYHLNQKEKALYFVNKALEIDPNNQRILKNKELYLKML